MDWPKLESLSIMKLVFALALLLFDYNRKLPLDVRESGAQQKDGVAVRDITFANLEGGRTAAYLVAPPGKGKFSGVLFVHWYEPASKDSNRTQFLEEALALAKKGTMSLLIETMWSDPKWFETRKPTEDFDNTVKQVKALRRALDVLLAQAGVDPKRLAYVGHDFGAMFGAVLAGVDHRPRAFALQAGTTSFSDWYLLGSPLKGEERQKFIEQMAPLDPSRYIGAAAPAAVLLQFGRSDHYVPEARATEFFASANEPKKILWYDAGHGLIERARQDRLEWLQEQLK